MKDNINILFTSSGRRVSLIQKFIEVFKIEGIAGKIITADLKESAPTSLFSDKHFIVPSVTDENYLQELLDICKRESINILIPLIDNELVLLSKNRHIFEEVGVKVLVSGESLNALSNNKIKTYEFFVKNNINTPKVYSESEINEGIYQFPLIIKPWDGSSSKGVIKLRNEKELIFFKDYINNAMVQEFVSGEEYTVDVFVDFEGNIKTIIPRLRIETRAGEVSKGMTKKDKTIIKACEALIKTLPEPVGCITLQCFKQDNGDITFIEINPRFGGGIPLSIEAGANFPLWTIEICSGKTFKEQYIDWKDNLTMLRFDHAVFQERNHAEV